MKAGLMLITVLIISGCAAAPKQPTSSCAMTEQGCVARGYAVRLKPGDDLRRVLDEFAARTHLRAAYVATCAGSLSVAAVRFADQKDATILTGPFEIVSLTGTFSPDGSHLHIAISDTSGRTIGGHLAEGALVYTTAEVVIGQLVGARFSRKVDATTSYKELLIE
jgi:predicted DNA-binding protein with PD1-like motif